MTSASVTFAGEEFCLTPQRALWWAARSALLVADVHLGKGAIFRSNGLAIPAGSTDADLARLSALLDRYCAEKLWVLGDFVHGSIDAELCARIAAWRRRHAEVDIELVRGNHDRHLGVVPPEWGLQVVAAGQAAGIELLHEPSPQPVAPQIAGHVHPVLRVRDGRRDVLRAPVFWVRPQALILPAFGSFTGGQPIAPQARDRVYLVGDADVVEAPLAVGL